MQRSINFTSFAFFLPYASFRTSSITESLGSRAASNRNQKRSASINVPHSPRKRLHYHPLNRAPVHHRAPNLVPRTFSVLAYFYFYFPQRSSYFHARGTRYSPGITSLINLVVITPLLVCKASGAGRSADCKTSFNVNVAGRASRFVAFSTLFTDVYMCERERRRKGARSMDPP